MSAQNPPRGGTLAASLLTGQAAGLIMAVVVVLVFTFVLGKAPYFPVQVIGSTLFGEAGLNGFHLNAFLAGLVLHQAGPSLLWGAVFALLAHFTRASSVTDALLLGLALGVVSMVGPYLLIPLVMQKMQGIDLWGREVPIFWDWAAHLVFGASFALFPAIQARLQG